MTDREIMQQALDALERYRNETSLGHQPHMIAHVADQAIADLRQVLGDKE